MAAVSAKICGITEVGALDAAVGGGARWLGFVFFPPSLRNLGFERAADLARRAPETTGRVGVFVEPSDDELAQVLARVPLTALQLHGAESPARVGALRARCCLPVIKAVPVAGADDLARARAYESCADWLMFDGKAPSAARAGGLPGGNAVAFDWRLLAGTWWRLPWLLSGGLDAANVAEAARVSGARHVDVSSGVESAPGVKDPARIRAFLAAIADIGAAAERAAE